jgi:hypothetical protein
MRHPVKAVAAGALAALVGAGAPALSFAQDTDLRRELQDLRQRLDLVEKKTAAAAPAAPAAAAAGDAGAAPAGSWAASLPVKFGGFVDAYYAYDFDRPASRDRAFTTQPARHNEFNVNLAYLDAVIAADRVRGRFALQTGTSVQSNYAGEPTQGSVSGPSLSRDIQEATAGYRVTDKLWLDGGIYFSHIGMESFISRDNWTYSRSLMGDFSPYYQAGVKASYQFSDAWSGQLHVLNGWQNISENNENKALGTQVAWAPAGGWSVTYNTFWGQEVGNQGRFFNDLVVKTPAWGKFQLEGAADYGIQHKPSGSGGFSKWYAGSLIGRYAFTERVAVAARVERYVDEDQVIVVTGGPAFKTTGASVNLDVQLHKQLVWRTEVRELWCENKLYPSAHGLVKNDGFVTTAFGLSF